VLHLAGPQSRIGDLLGPGGRTPYWAYCWAGGLVLARHILAHPETVEGRHVVDFGAGSGLVGIVAAQAGAASVLALEADSLGRAAIGLNAAANGVAISIAETPADPADLPAETELVLAGDVFYAPTVARSSLKWLTACARAGITVLIGDPGRRDLPRDQFSEIASYDVADFGSGEGRVSAGVYGLAASVRRPRPPGPAASSR
jgi:predicted nicotinamide N-methyase